MSRPGDIEEMLDREAEGISFCGARLVREAADFRVAEELVQDDDDLDVANEVGVAASIHLVRVTLA
ncbi:hypothetical protein C0993_010452 [Termitomyces sp. T159_Od127]|nr:hypothetical protein C0993_010452 [Termitomyces sp. T159_Od127]